MLDRSVWAGQAAAISKQPIYPMSEWNSIRISDKSAANKVRENPVRSADMSTQSASYLGIPERKKLVLQLEDAVSTTTIETVSGAVLPHLFDAESLSQGVENGAFDSITFACQTADYSMFEIIPDLRVSPY